MNKDFDERVVQSDTYRDAINFTLTNEGEFFSLSKIKSSGERIDLKLDSELVGQSVSKVELLGSQECNFPNEDKAVVLFVRVNNSSDAILTINIDTNEVYYTARGGDNNLLNFENVEYVDSVVDRDNGVDYVYFVDGVNIPRKISVEEGNNRYSYRNQLGNLKYGALDVIENIVEGYDLGSLLGGSYQLGYKLVNTETGVESTPSLFSNPINIVGSRTSDVESTYGLVPNEQSSSALAFDLKLTATDFESSSLLDLYDAVSLLVIESVDGNRVINEAVKVISPSKDIYERSRSGRQSIYTGRENFTVESLAEITIDQIPIASAKTISIKEGNIFYGNVKYQDLEIKEGEATIGEDNETVTQNIGLPSNRIKRNGSYVKIDNGSRGYKNASNTCKYKSERRGEVIRYGIAYANEYGNWSKPKAFDFSDSSAFKKNPSLSNLTASFIGSFEGETGTVSLVYSDFITIDTKVRQGDFLNLHLVKKNGNPDLDKNNIEVPCLIMKARDLSGAGIWGLDFDRTLLEDYDFTNFFDVLRGGEKNNSFSPDWKYPERKNSKFTLLNTRNQISAIGLQIGSISNHPEWAKAYAIVRVQRDKNILTQAVALPTQMLMPSTLDGLDDKDKPADANIFGTCRAKVLSKGATTNVWRPLSFDFVDPNGDLQQLSQFRVNESTANGISRSDSFGKVDTEAPDSFAISPVTKLISPDYMASNPANDEIYDSTWTNTKSKLNIVDAINYWNTKPSSFGGNTQTDNGSYFKDQQGFVFRADLYTNYYYRGNQSSVSLGGLYDSEREPSRQVIGDLSIKGTYPRVTAQEPTQAPVAFLPSNNYFKQLSNLGDLKGVNDFNEEVPTLENRVEQKGVYAVLDGQLGDLMIFNCFGSQEETNLYIKPWIDFSANRDDSPDGSPESNTIISKFGVGYSDRKQLFYSWNNTVQMEDNISGGVLPIVNIERGLSDDRYGDIKKEQNFFYTGTSGRIISPSTPINNVRIFGGDTFISKCYFKLNGSSYGLFNTGGESINLSTENRFIAYEDWHEVLGVFMESDVNFDLQADQYTYPVTRDVNGISFRYDYTYPYNFSYSVKNIAKIFRNSQKKEEEQTDFGNRIVYTDKHVINSLDNAYRTIRAGSFYDLDGSYGDIESLKRLNNNIYCLQRSGFSYIPVGKRTIEDGSGSELVINTTDVITTPQYILSKSGCQDIQTSKVSKNSLFWLDRERREVYIFRGEGIPTRISDNGMYSYFNEQVLPITNIWASYDFDKEEYLISLDNYYAVFSEKIGVWTSRLFLNNNNRLFGANDRLYAVGAFFGDGKIEKMYAGDDYGKILNSGASASLDLIMNENAIISKTFDSVRIDSTKSIDSGRMSVNTDNNTTLDTGQHVLPTRQTRQGGYEVYTIRDRDTKQRMRGKAMLLNLLDSDRDNPNSINSVMLKYRESRDTFFKQAKNAQ